VNLGAQTAQASPVQLVLILMGGLQEELARARGHIAGRRFELKARSLDKCIGILHGLSSALDLETGNEVVKNLAELYDYCVHRLYEAGHRLDPAIVDEVSNLLATIERGWRGVQASNG
jgi:flagellar protein FliS